MKIVKRCCISIFAIVLLYLFVSLGVRGYVRKNTAITFMGDKYTKFDCLQGNFMPFDSDNSWYKDNIGYYNLFGMSFLKSDIDKNFVYYKDLLGSTVYKKDSYDLPDYPDANMVDKLVVYYEEKDEDITIDNKDDISEIIHCFSTLGLSGDSEKKDSIIFYAVSKRYGGVYQLNEIGSVYSDSGKIKYGYSTANEFPVDIQNIIRSYQN